jgi:ribosomal protein L20
LFNNNRLIPNHQFSFRQRHSTKEQMHKIIQRINEALENKQYCSAAFLDISQAFDKA